MSAKDWDGYSREELIKVIDAERAATNRCIEKGYELADEVSRLQHDNRVVEAMYRGLKAENERLNKEIGETLNRLRAAHEERDTLQGQLRAANKHCEIAVDGRDKARAREDGLRRLLLDISQTLGDELCDCGYYVSAGMKNHSDSCLKFRTDAEVAT